MFTDASFCAFSPGRFTDSHELSELGELGTGVAGGREGPGGLPEGVTTLARGSRPPVKSFCVVLCCDGVKGPASTLLGPPCLHSPMSP